MFKLLVLGLLKIICQKKSLKGGWTGFRMPKNEVPINTGYVLMGSHNIKQSFVGEIILLDGQIIALA